MNATFAVTDRLGNVLAVFRMADASLQTQNVNAGGTQNVVTVTSRRTPAVTTGLDGVDIIPDTLAAIAKAVTGAYLTSEGNAFTTRTANQIVQQHFNPGEENQPSGPLFGVQFSQLPCSDFSQRFTAGLGADAGPKRSPLGLSADPGGMPLYKFGTPVGGVGVISDGIYGMDLVISDIDQDQDEIIAVNAGFGFAPPVDRRGDHITVDGKTFRFSDADYPSQAPTTQDFDTQINGVVGSLMAVPGYTDGNIVAGQRFGQLSSGVAPADSVNPGLFPGLDAFVIVDNNGNNRFPPIDGTDGLLTSAEVTALLSNAIAVANKSRAQIRQPFGSKMRVSVSIVDTNGTILGIARTRDAPIFGLDVSLQKARTAAFFSNVNAANDLLAVPDNVFGDSIAGYVQKARDFLGDQTALSNGIAFSDRGGGNLSRPYFPDGLIQPLNGPFSRPFGQWSPFSTGLQLDSVATAVVSHVLFAAGAAPTDVDPGCTGMGRVANGFQIFPGSVPVYRGNTLVGGIGVSGDGVDQDDMVSFLGLNNAGLQTGTINNAPKEIRSDTVEVPGTGVHLRYVQCPQAPFLDSNEQNVCEGL